MVLIRHSRHAKWLSNSWLVADRPGGHAVVIDTGAPIEPLLKVVEDLRLTPTHVLNTHHHHDHVETNGEWASSFGCSICGHAAEQELIPGLTATLSDGEEIRSGDLHIRALHIPGHTQGQLAFLVDGTSVFTGDTLFRGSVGGTRAPGHGTFEELQHSVMNRLMTLPPDTEIYPGHMEASSVAREWEENPFIRRWRAEDAATESPCDAFGQPARLLLRAADYDGGSKCWVRFEDGTEDLVPGSRVIDLD